MNSSTVIDKISDLNYKGFKEAYIRQMENVNYHQLSFDERVYDLLDRLLGNIWEKCDKEF